MRIKFNFKKIFYDNRILFFVALFGSILLWFIVVTQVNSDYQRTIWSVPITVDEKNATLTENGLHAIDQSVGNISVEVSGPRDKIGKLTSKDFVVTPGLSTVTKPGKYTLTLNADLVFHDPYIKITKVKPSTTDITFDTYTTAAMPVSVAVKNGGAAQGYSAQTPSANPDKVNITGPSSIVSKIKRAQVNVDIGKNATDTVNTTGNILLLDSAGNQLESPYLKLSSKTADVTVPVYKQKELQLKLSFFNLPSGLDQSNIGYTMSPATITVAGPAQQIDALTDLSVQNVDAATLDVTNHFTYQIALPAGITNVDNIKTVDADISLNSISAKTFNITSITPLNVPANHKAEVLTAQIGNVKLFGPSSGIASLAAISATVDLSGITRSGTYRLPAQIVLPGSNYWLQSSKYTVTVKVRWGY